MSNPRREDGGRASIVAGRSLRAEPACRPEENQRSVPVATGGRLSRNSGWPLGPARFAVGCFALLLATSPSARSAEVPVFIFAGQSIAINSGTDTGFLPPELLAAQTNVLFYNARTQDRPTSAVHWVTYQPPTGPGYADCGHTNSEGSFGPELSAAGLISTRFYAGNPVAVFKYAVGATTLSYSWNPTLPGPLYADMHRCLSNALAALQIEVGCTGQIAGVFWTQGESDALAGVETAAAYGSNLWRLVTTLRQGFGHPRLPFVYGRILPQWPNAEGVRAGQESLTNLLEDVFMADADDLWTPTRHYDNDGTITLGHRYAEGFSFILASRMRLDIAFDDGIRLRLYGLPSARYVIQYADSAASSDWHDLTSGQADVLGMLDFRDLPPPQTPMRFYRFMAQ